MRRSPLLIVTSPANDHGLWAELLSLGGYDVLIKPFQTDEVLRVLGVALDFWSDPPCQRSAVHIRRDYSCQGRL
jgi:DNA-binding response OmpR family regulator